MKNRIDALLAATLRRCFDNKTLTECQVPYYVIEVPNHPDHGHFATNLPLTLASAQKRSPREIASTLLENMVDEDAFLEAVDVAGPGFINFRISVKE